MSGHHRIIAAELAGIEIPESAIVKYSGVTSRPVYDWSDVISPMVTNE
jgi:hypothetical protein